MMQPYTKLLIGLGLLTLSACTSMKPVGSFDAENKAESIRASIHVGDYIAITKTNGEKYGFEITAISKNSIAGGSINISYDDIAAVHTEQVDVKESLGTSIGVISGFSSGYFVGVIAGLFLLLIL